MGDGLDGAVDEAGFASVSGDATGDCFVWLKLADIFNSGQGFFSLPFASTNAALASSAGEAVTPWLQARNMRPAALKIDRHNILS